MSFGNILLALAIFMGVAELFYFGWSNEKHSSLLLHPEGESLAPNFRGIPGKYFQNKDKLWLHYTADYPTQTPKGNVFVVHGLGGYHFAPLCKELQKAGFNAYAYEYQGWGKSEGDPGHLGPGGVENAFSDFRDFVNFIQTTDANAKSSKTFCFGKALGGLILLNEALINTPICPDGIILAAPALAPNVTTTVRTLVSYLSKFLPRAPVRLTDGHVTLRARAATTITDFIFDQLPELIANNKKKLPPTLILQGDTDYITTPLATQQLHSVLEGSVQKVYQGCDHDLQDRPEMNKDVAEWLTQLSN